MKKITYQPQTFGRKRLGLPTKLSFLFFVCIFFSRSAMSQTLVWEDNFNDASINEDIWTFDFGDGCERGICGWGNSELQYYTSRPENARIENGNLVIEARQEAFLGKNYTSARLKTEGRLHFTYGTLEARIKVPDLENGLWPAFWLLGTTGAWPQNGEIDIMEMGSSAAIQAGLTNKKVGAAVHWSYNGSQADYSKDHDSPTDLNNGYHLYKMVWDPQFIKVYVDNIEYFTFDISDVAANSLEEFHIPHFILLNLAVGGTYTGVLSSAGITAPMPGEMLIDYIKLYQNNEGTLYVGSQHAESGSFGVYTESTSMNNALTYGVDANLFVWNNLTPISGSPYEGNEALAFRASAGQWYGMGIATDYKNMSNFYEGTLKFHMKTISTETFKIGISTGHGDSWIDFVNGGEEYGLVRDGNWHEVSIPFSEFYNLDLHSVKQMFMLTGGPYGADMEIFIDNIYYSGGGTANVSPQVTITSPANNTTANTGTPLTINATASDTDGSVTLVEFFADGVKLGEDTSSPYNYTWGNPDAGSHTLTAKATDNANATGTSSAVAVIIENNSNNLSVPGLIQAEAYHDMQGIDTEGTSDKDGGENVGWIDNGDWMDYTVTVAASGTYTVNLRVASLSGGGILQIQSGSNTLASVNIGATGDWQNWVTISTSVNLSAGVQTLRLYAVNGGFNVNWMEFSSSNSSSNGCNFTAANGDYSATVSEEPMDPSITFSPLINGVGATTAILYYGTAINGPLPGYPVTPGVPFQINASKDQTVYFYYTYSVPEGGERNTANSRHSFTVGNCATENFGLSAVESDKNQSFSNILDQKGPILYPNPTEGWARISEEFHGGVVRVMNALGKIVFETVLSSGKLNLSQLPKGYYFIDIRKGNKHITERVIKR